MKRLNRNYTMSDAALYMLASNLTLFMRRDAAEFAVRGVSAAAIDAFDALGKAFGAFPGDGDYLGLANVEAAAKTKLRSSLIGRVQFVRGFFIQRWGRSAIGCKRLGMSKYQSLKETDFLYRSLETARIARECLAALSPVGLTPAAIEALESDCRAYEDRMNALADAKATRAKMKAERSKLGNELYYFAVKYAEIGKLIWMNTNAAKYKDYVIYKNEGRKRREAEIPAAEG